jgi:hypothetical protein
MEAHCLNQHRINPQKLTIEEMEFIFLIPLN